MTSRSRGRWRPRRRRAAPRPRRGSRRRRSRRATNQAAVAAKRWPRPAFGERRHRRQHRQPARRPRRAHRDRHREQRGAGDEAQVHDVSSRNGRAGRTRGFPSIGRDRRRLTASTRGAMKAAGTARTAAIGAVADRLGPRLGPDRLLRFGRGHHPRHHHRALHRRARRPRRDPDDEPPREAERALARHARRASCSATSTSTSTPEVRCAILTGAGGNFSSGADLVAMGQQSDDPKVQEVMARGNNPHWKALLRDYRLSEAADRRGRGLRGRRRHRDPAGHRHPRRGRGRDLRRVGSQARPVPARRFRVPACRARSRTRMRWTSCCVPAGPARSRRRRSASSAASCPTAPRSTSREAVAAAGRGERAALDAGDPARVARDRAHERLRRDAAPGQDRLGGLRERRRAGRPEGLRREARARYKGK